MTNQLQKPKDKFITLPVKILVNHSLESNDYLVKHLVFKLDFDFENRAVAVRAKLLLNLLNNQSKKIVLNCQSKNINQVKINETPISYEFANNFLYLDLQSDYQVNEEMIITVDFASHLDKLEIDNSSYSLVYVCPVLANSNAQCSYDIITFTKPKYAITAQGKLVEQYKYKNRLVSHWLNQVEK